jgi:predicted metal-dependent hydrolase
MSTCYTVRESQRAKHVSLRLSASGKLEVVVPPGFDQSKIPALVQQKQGWIDRVSQRVQPSALGPSSAQPDQICLAAIGETWQVEYQSSSRTGVQIRQRSGCKLLLTGNLDDQATSQLALQQWVAAQAKLHLVPWLRKVSREVELPFALASIRRQKTLWGSCSGSKNISLNCKLLFLPSPIVRYIMIHELSHTVHMDHSAKFWALVSRHEPHHRQRVASLRELRHLVPPWMED